MASNTTGDLLEPLVSTNRGKKISFLLPPPSEEEEPITATPQVTKELSPLIAVCFTVNYLVGTGFLTLPWAFSQGGIVLSTILLIVATLFSDFSKDFLLEGMARAEEVVPHPNEHTQTHTGGNEEEAVEKGEQDDNDDSDAMLEEGPLLVKDRKFEMADLTRIFLGEKATIVFIFLLSFSLFMTLWAYTVVFVTVLQDQFNVTGNPDKDAIIYTFIFACIVVPLSCLELKEQITIQVILAICRLLMLFFMVTTTLIYPHDFRGKQYSPDENPFSPVPLVNFAGIAAAFPIILFALGFTTAVPGISQTVSDKRQLGTIFRTTFFVCALAYILVGVTVPLATGATVAQSANVMWSNFRAGTGTLNEETGEYENVVWWAKAISLFVVNFPAVDVISAFPLNAIVLGSNLLDTFFEGESHKSTIDREKVIFFRLLSSIPPVSGALFIRKLGIVTDYTGTLFFVKIFCFPALIYIMSKDSVVGTSKKTFYHTLGTNNPVAIFTTIFGAVMFVYLVYEYATGALV